MNFLHFEKADGSKLNSAKIPGYQLFGETFDDIDFKLTIIGGKIKVDLIVDPYFTQGEIDDINEFIKSEKIDWNAGYEFVDYYDLNTGEDLYLIADKNSDVFNIVNSNKNLSLVDNMLKKLNEN